VFASKKASARRIAYASPVAATLASIHVYPLKSCAPLPLDAASVKRRGIAHDRRWLIVDADNRFITAREHPRLTLIRATVGDDGLHLAAPEMPPLRVGIPRADTSRITVTIWDDRVTPLPADARANAWISEFLGKPCTIVYMDESCVRATDPDWSAPGDEVSFADGYPLLLISQTAVDHLNERLQTPVPALRFRPNLLMEGTEPHAEDGWKRIRIGDIEFDVVKPCIRCIFTTVDFLTGAFDPSGEPLRTLIKYRRTPKGVAFGQNLIPRGDGVLRVGDPVTVLAAAATNFR
jgi:hypothetical protein